MDTLIPSITTPRFAPTLLHGVTGSGKTEVYKKLIEHSFSQGKSVLLLLPEVSLSMQFERLLKAQLPAHIPLFGFHSASKDKEKKLLWSHLTHNKPCLVVGVHLPVFLPINKLGLIIIDEEHETGFQEKKHPKINSKQAALIRAQTYQIPILLGSATPSISSLHQVALKKWDMHSMTKRFSGSFPTIKLVSLNNKKRRKNFWITQELEKAITETLEKKEQVIIYLNRRGYSFFVQCKSCGFIFECPDCSVSLTLHSTGADMLRCHYCDMKKELPTACPDCKAGERELLKKGIGTQQIFRHLESLFPQAKIARADLDSTKKKREWHETVEQFGNGEIDIMVGTQLVTKGYHFPNVTLVGVIWADLNLHFPVYNASEMCLQKLIQVAGRAGRSKKQSTVIVQAMNEHPIFSYLDEKRYLDYCTKEQDDRKQTGYPPFKRLAQIELKSTNSDLLGQEGDQLMEIINAVIEKHQLDIMALGPCQPLVYRIQKMESLHIYLKANSFRSLEVLLGDIDLEQFESSVYFVPEG